MEHGRVFVPDDWGSDLDLFVRSWVGQLGSCHLVMEHDHHWVTVRVTRASLPERLCEGPFLSVLGGQA